MASYLALVAVGRVTGQLAEAPPQDAPAWANLLPIVPALSLAIAFTLDRIRITLVAAAGTWALRTATYLAVGLVLWVGFATWVSDYQFSRLNGNAASYTGYAIRKLDAPFNQHFADGFHGLRAYLATLLKTDDRPLR